MALDALGSRGLLVLLALCVFVGIFENTFAAPRRCRRTLGGDGRSFRLPRPLGKAIPDDHTL
jgi:hypothetical protein